MNKETVLEFLYKYGPRIIGSVLILFVGFYVVKLITKLLEKTLSKSKIDISLHSFIRSLAGFLMKIVVLITAAGMLGVETTTFIALLSAAGLAIGLALKDSLSNFAGGILILTFKPFKIGDFIEIDGSMGSVKEIQILYTYLCTPDNKRIAMPNGQLANAKVINYSAESTRRLDLVFGISYNDNILKVKELLTSIVSSHTLIHREPTPVIRVLELADSSVNFAVRVWCKTEDYWTVHFDLHEAVKLTFDKEGVTIPYPQRDIHIKK